MLVPVFFVQLHPYFLAYVEMYLRTHAVLHIVLLPVLGMLILYGLLSHQVVGTVCIYYQSLITIRLYYYYYTLFLSTYYVLILSGSCSVDTGFFSMVSATRA
jgi:hypothetical protein